MSKDKIIIHPKHPKGDDGYKTFSIRIKETYLSQLEQLCAESGCSRNELIVKFIEYGLQHCEVVK